MTEADYLDLVKQLSPAGEGVFEVNEHGVWCVYCDHHVDAPWTIKGHISRNKKHYRECCPQCGWDGEAPG